MEILSRQTVLREAGMNLVLTQGEILRDQKRSSIQARWWYELKPRMVKARHVCETRSIQNLNSACYSARQESMNF